MDRFIEAVKSYPCVWNIQDSSYKEQKLKDVAWEEIAKKCGMVDGKTAKQKWKNLKDSLRDAMKRQVTRSGQECQNVKPWKYQSLMEFITPHMKNRPRDTNPDPHCSAQQVDDSSSNIVQYEEQENAGSLEEDTTDSTHEMKRKKGRNDFLDSSDKVLQFLKDQQKRKEIRGQERAAKRRELKEEDPLSEFFKSMYNTSKKLPLASQLKIKRTLFNVVTEEEDKYLVRSASSSRQSLCSNSLSPMSGYSLTTLEPVIKIGTPFPSQVQPENPNTWSPS